MSKQKTKITVIKEDLKKNGLTYLMSIFNFIYDTIINKKDEKTKQKETVEENPVEEEFEPNDSEEFDDSISSDDILITPENWQEHLNPDYYYEPNDCINCLLVKNEAGLIYTKSVHWSTEERAWVCDVCNENC